MGCSFERQKKCKNTNAFQRKLNTFSCKPNKIWVDKGSRFYNRSMKSWLQDNVIEMCSTHNEGKPVIAERFIRTLKNKILQIYDFSMEKCVY